MRRSKRVGFLSFCANKRARLERFGRWVSCPIVFFISACVITPDPRPAIEAKRTKCIADLSEKIEQAHMEPRLLMPNIEHFCFDEYPLPR